MPMRIVALLLSLFPALAIAQGHGVCSFRLGANLTKSQSLRDLAGVYELEWHESRELINQPKIRRERLWLWRTAPTDSAHTAPSVRPALGDTIIYPLYGTTTQATVSSAAGDSLRALTDPLDPPVLLDLRGDGTRPRLLLYTVASRRPGVITLDGGGVAATLTHVGLQTLFGEYRAYGILHIRPGFLCARRLQ